MESVFSLFPFISTFDHLAMLQNRMQMLYHSHKKNMAISKTHKKM